MGLKKISGAAPRRFGGLSLMTTLGGCCGHSLITTLAGFSTLERMVARFVFFPRLRDAGPLLGCADRRHPLFSSCPEPYADQLLDLLCQAPLRLRLLLTLNGASWTALLSVIDRLLQFARANVANNGEFVGNNCTVTVI